MKPWKWTINRNQHEVASVRSRFIRHFYGSNVAVSTEKKKKHNQLIKVENCDLFGRLSEDSSMGGSLSDSFEGLLRKGREPEYIGVLATKIR